MEFKLSRIKEKNWAILIFIIAYSVYIYSAGRVNNGMGDSDEILTTSYLLSVAHPPGYPLQILLTKFFMMLPLGGTAAFRANLLAGFCHSLTAVLVFLISNRILKKIVKGKEIRWIVSASTSLILVFSALFWLYSSVLEVHSLGNLLAILTIYFALMWQEQFESLKSADLGKNELKYFLLTLLCLGVGVGHLQTIVLIIPALVLIFISSVKAKSDWREYIGKRIGLGILIAGLAFVIPNLLLFYFNSREQNFSWFFGQSWGGWWFHVRRQVYKGFYVERGTNIDSAYIAKFDLRRYIRTLPLYLKYLGDHFTLIGLVLGILGANYWYDKDKKSCQIFLMLFVITGPLFALYMGLPEEGITYLLYRNEVGVAHRQYLIGEMFFSFFIGMGLLAIFKKIKSKSKLLIAALLSLSVVAFLIFKNQEIGVRRDDTFAHDFAREVLGSTEENAVIFCSGDFSCFGMTYMQEVEGYRLDVSVLPYNIYLKRYYLDRHPELKGFEKYLDNPFHFADLITWNLSQGRPTYFVDLDDYYVGYVGLDGNPFYLEPRGYLFKIVTKLPDRFESYDYELTRQLITQANDDRDYLQSGLKDYFANNHTSMGLLYSYMNMKDEARKNFLLAMELNPEYQSAKDLFETLPGFDGRQDYLEIKESSSSAFYHEKALAEIEKGMLDEAYTSLRKATYRDPLDNSARMELAKLFKTGGYFQYAIYELENTLKYHPDYEEAIMLKEELEASMSGTAWQLGN